MANFLLSERYRLELHWKEVIYEQDGICELKEAYFSGPALSHANKINCDDNILIDFYSQYVLLVKSVFVAKLSWKNVIYNTDNTVSLKDVFITHNKELNTVPQLKNTDYLVIDTSDHEEVVHARNLVYKTYVIAEDGKEYNFGS